jgi:hypothetical protein
VSSVATCTLGSGSDRVGAQRVQLLERVGRVAGEHHVPAGVIDADHRDVTGRVPRRVDGDDPSVIAERAAAGKRPERAAVERERLGREPGGQRLAQHAAHHPRHRRGEEAQLHLVDQDPTANMDQPVHVVAVGVGEHHLGDVVERRPAAAIAAGSSCSRVTCMRANGTLRAAAVSPVSTSRRTPSCSIAQQWIGSGSDQAPGRNRSSCRRAPGWRGTGSCA